MGLFDSATLERCQALASKTVQRDGKTMRMVRQVINKTLTVRHLNGRQPTTLLASATSGKTLVTLLRSADVDGTYYRLGQTGKRYYSIADFMFHEKPATLVVLARACQVPLTRSMMPPFDN